MTHKPLDTQPANKGVSAVVGVLILVVIVLLLSTGVYLTASTLTSDQPTDMTAGTTTERISFYEYETDLVTSGNAQSVHVVSPLGTHYKLNQAGASAKILAVQYNQSRDGIGRLRIQGYNEESANSEAQLLNSQKVENGIQPDYIVAKDGTGDYTSIQTAINNAPPATESNPFIIVVERNTYTENIDVSQNITLIAEHGTVIQDANPNEPVVHITGNNSKVQNFIVDADPSENDGHYGSHGIRVGGTNAEVIGNTVRNASSPDLQSAGIAINSKYTFLKYNSISNNEQSVSLMENSESPIVCGNQFNSSIGGYASQSTQQSLAMNNYWSGGVPSNLIPKEVKENFSATEMTDLVSIESVSSKVPASMLPSSSRAGQPFPGTKLMATQNSGCQVNVQLVNTGGGSILLSKVKVTINKRNATVQSSEELSGSTSGQELADRRSKTTAVCDCGGDGSYDKGDRITVYEPTVQNKKEVNTTIGSDEMYAQPLDLLDEGNPDPRDYSLTVPTGSGPPLGGGGPDLGQGGSVGGVSYSVGASVSSDSQSHASIAQEEFKIELGTEVKMQLGDEVVLQPVVKGAEGNVTYSWSLGDGTTASTRVVRHIYPTKGSYQVSVTVTDTATGETDTDTVIVDIEKGQKDVQTVSDSEALIDQATAETDGSGKILYLSDGRYSLSEVRTGDLTIVGQGDNVVFTGPVSVYASGVSFRNVEFKNGVSVYADNFKIYGSTIQDDSGYAVEVDTNGETVYIGQSQVSAPNGIYTNIDSGVDISDSQVIASGSKGIVVGPRMDDVSITSNDISAAEYGVYIGHLTDYTTSKNTISADTRVYQVPNKPPVIEGVSADVTLAGLPTSFNVDVSDPQGDRVPSVFWEVQGETVEKSPGENYVYTVSSEGVVPISVTAQDSSQETTTKTKRFTFTAPSINITTPPLVSTDDSVTAKVETNIPDKRIHSLTYTWGTGESERSGKLSESTSYSSTGNYTVSVQLTTDSGYTISEEKPLNVTDSPVADFYVTSQTGNFYVGNKITFDASPSTAPNGEELTYTWNINGDEYSGDTASKTFTDFGTYDITLTATGSDGFSGSVTKRLKLTRANVSIDSPTGIGVDTPTTFDISTSADPYNRIDKYLIDWDGDRQVEQETSSSTIQHTFTELGTRTIIVEAVDTNTDSHSLTQKTITVRESPTFDVQVEDTTINAGDTIDFSISNVENATNPAYKWNFGDGLTTTGRTATHTFSSPGTYTVDASVISETGVTRTKQVSVTVSEFTAKFTINDTTPSIDSPVTFNASSSQTLANTTYTWNFGDRSTQQTGMKVTHVYDTTGTYTVSLTLTNEYGTTVTTQKEIVVSKPGTADFNETFEDAGLNGWVTQHSDFKRVTGNTHSGTGAASITQSGVGQQDIAVASVYNDNGKPTEMTFYWRETETSNNGGIMLRNSNGDTEVGFLTQNPQWNTYDSQGYTEVYGGSGYGQWVKVKYVFDWDTNTYEYTITDLENGHTENGQGELRHGVGIENLVVYSESGDMNYWVDDISFNGDPLANIHTDVQTVKTGETIQFTSPDSTGVGATYNWNFDNGETATGQQATHTYTTPGTYDVSFTVTDKYGETATDYTTITVEETTKTYREGFETGTTDTWTQTHPQEATVTIDSNTQFNGSYSGRINTYAPRGVLASDVAYPDGKQPNKFVYYYKEQRNSNSGGIELVNTDGNVEVGFHTQNPEWNIVNETGEHQIYGYPNGHQYGQWVKVAITLNWQEDTYGYTIKDLESGHIEEGYGALGDGKNVKNVTLVSPPGDEVRMWFDDIQLQTGTHADMGVVKDHEVSIRAGETVTLNAYQSYGDNATYTWDFGDGTTITKNNRQTVSHTYGTGGTYTVTLNVTSENGASDSTTTQVTVDDDNTYSLGFENGIPSSFITNTNVEHRTDYAVKGTSSLGVFNGYAPRVIATDTMYPDGKQIESFSYYFREQSRSTGAGIRLVNSNGEYEVGSATGNPEWWVTDKNGNRRVYNPSQDTYNHWVHVQLTFNWEDNTYAYKFTNTQTGNTQTGVGQLKQGVDVEKIQFENYDTSFQGGEMYTWFDEIHTTDQTTFAQWTGDETGNVGESLSFDATTSSIATGSGTYEWDFNGDGTIDATGLQTSHTYTKSGNYTVTLTVTDGTGTSDTLTRTVHVENYIEGYESATTGWTYNTGSNFVRTPIYEESSGDFGGKFHASNTQTTLASTTPFPSGKQPDTFVYYYKEPESSTGAGIRLVNSNGEYEAGFATDNPQWVVSDATGLNVVKGSNGQYQNWIRVEYNFHWQNNTFGYKVTNTDTGLTRVGTGQLKHGTDISKIEVSGYSGYWTGNDEAYITVDNIQLKDSHKAFYSVDKTSLRLTEEITFNGQLSVGTDATYKWDFNGDGTTDATGLKTSHAYTTTGTYSATLTVTDATKSPIQFSREITVTGGKFTESFENGLSAWRIYDGNFETRTDRVYTGQQSAGGFDGWMNKRVASTVLYPDGKEIQHFEYTFQEQYTSTGGGIRFKNSNGNFELGVTTDNPEWDVSDKDGTREVSSGSGYDRWVHVSITFDWKHNQYRYRFTDLQSGKTAEGIGTLRYGQDIRSIEIQAYTSGSWQSGDFNMWFDNLTEVPSETHAYPYVPTDGEVNTPIQFTTGTTSTATETATYEWDFNNDGTVDTTGKTPTYTYSTTGTKTVSLTVIDANGETDTKTQTITIFQNTTK